MDTEQYELFSIANSAQIFIHLLAIGALSTLKRRYPNMNLNSPDLNTTEIIDNITVPVPKSKDEIRMLYSVFPDKELPSFEESMGTTVNGSFSMAGLDFCLDLCLDHARGVCAAALDAEKAAGGRGEVDVQLIVSAGMSIIPDNTRIPIGGECTMTMCKAFSSLT